MRDAVVTLSDSAAAGGRPPETPRGHRAERAADVLTVREMLGLDAMRGAWVIAGRNGLDRLVRRLNMMSVPNIVRWTKQDEFLLATGYPLPRQAGEFCQLIGELAANGLAGLGVKLDEYLDEIPAAAVQAANEVSFPIIGIPGIQPLDDVLSQTFETIVNRQAAALARREHIHDAFLRVALAGGGLSRLSDELAAVLPGADVIICDPEGNELAATPRTAAGIRTVVRDGDGRLAARCLAAGVHTDPHTNTQQAVAVIRAGDMQHGYVLAVGGPDGLPAVAGLAVEQAALVAALQITRDLAVLAVEQQFASNALHDLVTGTAANTAHATARAARFGWDLQRPLTVLVAWHCATDKADDAPMQEAAALRAGKLWAAAIRERDPDAAVAGFAAELVALVGAANAETLARSVRAEISASTGYSYSLGVSQIARSPQYIARMYQQARIALQVGLRTGGGVTSFAGLGLYRLLSTVNDAELRAFLQDNIGPVLDLPEPSRSDLLKSLDVLSETRYNVAESARILHYHYNTMRYRVTKLERLLGDFTTDASVGLRVGVALEILRMQRMAGDSLAAPEPQAEGQPDDSCTR